MRAWGGWGRFRGVILKLQTHICWGHHPVRARWGQFGCPDGHHAAACLNVADRGFLPKIWPNRTRSLQQQ